ncbi:hypothetical protein PN478_03230 [Dolichospermum circinale CS-534/05]|uniref:hypothetical protein n=1 Tax=Dolichospermum circinale TaxID=109265 RepID=UPI00232D2B8A|nr:hypothetical protein [Dolichospermum circinale]MDB9489538.1 hypothetical protein [Dolichospermum circinale CS-534/05]
MVLVERSHFLNFPNSDRTPQTSQTAIAPLQLPNSDRTPSTFKTAIAPLQLPQTSFFNEPQRHRGHRERAIAPAQPPKQRYLRSASLSHSLNPQTAIPSVSFAIAPLNFPNSDTFGALRYRTLQTSQTAIALPSTSQKRTACSSASLSHPLNFPRTHRR